MTTVPPYARDWLPMRLQPYALVSDVVRHYQRCVMPKAHCGPISNPVPPTERPVSPFTGCAVKGPPPSGGGWPVGGGAAFRYGARGGGVAHPSASAAHTAAAATTAAVPEG